MLDLFLLTLERKLLHSADLQLIGRYSLERNLVLECNTAREGYAIVEFYAT